MYSKHNTLSNSFCMSCLPCRVTEGLGRFLFQQLILALDFCHLRGKVSRGVKLANTMLQLSPGQLPLLKLADFGFSKDTHVHSAAQSQVGAKKGAVFACIGEAAQLSLSSSHPKYWERVLPACVFCISSCSCCTGAASQNQGGHVAPLLSSRNA